MLNSDVSRNDSTNPSNMARSFTAARKAHTQRPLRKRSAAWPASSEQSRIQRRATRTAARVQRQLDLLRNEVTSWRVVRVLRLSLSRNGRRLHLPGYNFTRLPLRVCMLPGSDASVEFISRPRHISRCCSWANSVIYHKGSEIRDYPIARRSFWQPLPENAVRQPQARKFISSVAKTANVTPLPVLWRRSNESGKQGASALPASTRRESSRATQRSRITCEEEERCHQGLRHQHLFHARRPHTNWLDGFGESQRRNPAATALFADRAPRLGESQMADCP